MVRREVRRYISIAGLWSFCIDDDFPEEDGGVVGEISTTIYLSIVVVLRYCCRDARPPCLLLSKLGVNSFKFAVIDPASSEKLGVLLWSFLRIFFFSSFLPIFLFLSSAPLAHTFHYD